MTGYCANTPLECRRVQSFVWASLLVSFVINISQYLYANSLKRRYIVLQEQMPILNALLEEAADIIDLPEAEIPEARPVSEV
tara:strand:+ start:617 stop:862 length:246 start_codon:yes stop_codon:yes gene_type:complete